MKRLRTTKPSTGCVNTIRALSLDTVQRAESGQRGLSLAARDDRRWRDLKGESACR
jgi:hypothetical protein